MKLFCAVMFSAVIAASAVLFKDCGSSSCMINSVDVNNCAPDAQSCDFPRGTTVKMTLKFTTKSPANDLKSIVEGEIGGTWVPFNTSDACPSITPSCPIAANTASTFELDVPISQVYPTISVPIKSELKDGSGGECTCFLMQGKIV